MEIEMQYTEYRYIQRLDSLLDIESELIVELRITLNAKAKFLLEKFLIEHDDNDGMVLKHISKVEDRRTHYRSTAMLNNLIKMINQNKKGLGRSFSRSHLVPTLASLDQMSNVLLDDMTPITAEFLGGAGLDAELHSEDTIKTLIQAVPMSLSYQDSKGDIPIRKLVWNSYISGHSNPFRAGSDDENSKAFYGFNSRGAPLIPILAEQGVKRNVGGEGQRGGLLVTPPNVNDNVNVIRILTMCQINSKDASIALSILKRLREMDLFTIQDIKVLDLLYICCNQHTSQLFEFVIQWHPELLKEWRSPYDTNANADTGVDTVTQEPKSKLKVPFLHEVIDYTFRLAPSLSHIELSKQIVEVAVKAALRYHPDRLGFLNERNRNGYTVWERACDKIGMYRMWDVVERCISTDESEDAGTKNDNENRKSDNNFLFESEGDPNIFFTPLFLAAVESDDDSAFGLNVVFHLLKKDPAKWISYISHFKARLSLSSFVLSDRLAR